MGSIQAAAAPDRPIPSLFMEAPTPVRALERALFLLEEPIKTSRGVFLPFIGCGQVVIADGVAVASVALAISYVAKAVFGHLPWSGEAVKDFRASGDACSLSIGSFGVAIIGSTLIFPGTRNAVVDLLEGMRAAGVSGPRTRSRGSEMQSPLRTVDDGPSPDSLEAMMGLVSEFASLR